MPAQESDQRPERRGVVAPAGAVILKEAQRAVARQQWAEESPIGFDQLARRRVERPAQPRPDRDLETLFRSIVQECWKIVAEGLDEQVLLPPAGELPVGGQRGDQIDNAEVEKG